MLFEIRLPKQATSLMRVSSIKDVYLVNNRLLALFTMSENKIAEKEYFRKIEDIVKYSEEQYDKLIVTLNSGALVLTVGFVSDIVKITESINTILLKLSWISFSLSLLLILISHLTSKSSMLHELSEKTGKSDKMNRATNRLNYGSLFALLSGIILFITFVSNTI